MPGGSAAAWPHIRPIFEAVAARTREGDPCCAWMGADGAGHFVKMVHNGIEYGDMQIICETYDLMKRGLGMSNAEMANVFGDWNAGELDSYLIEITRDILAFRDERGEAVVDSILDVAGQKGTGKWTVTAALDEGMPLTLIGEAVFARCLAATKDERVAAAQRLGASGGPLNGERQRVVDDLRQALYAAKLVSYAQGYQLLRAAAHAHQWKLDFGAIAQTWRGGCIIRSRVLERHQKGVRPRRGLKQSAARSVLQASGRNQTSGVAARGRRCHRRRHSGAVLECCARVLDGYRAERLPANLLQAQRDYFGAHQYERIDAPRGQFFHTNWTGRGGATTSQAYST